MRWREYRVMMVKDMPSAFQAESRKCYLCNYIVAYQILSLPVLVSVPSRYTYTYLLNMLTWGMRTLSNLKYLIK